MSNGIYKYTAQDVKYLSECEGKSIIEAEQLLKKHDILAACTRVEEEVMIYGRPADAIRLLTDIIRTIVEDE